MGLRFYIGGSGAGKSKQLYDDIIRRSMEESGRNFLIVVPDQFTMQTQKELVLSHPRGGIMNIDVLSFGRLSHRIFEEVGGNEKPVLDDTGKSLIIRKLAENRAKELETLGGNLNKIGYIHEVKSVLSEFMQYGIGEKELESLVEYSKPRGSLHYKLRDLKVLYHDFLSYINEKYITTEETLDLLCSVLHKSKVIRDAVIVFDGFTGFTPIQNHLIGELMGVCSEVIITCVIDERENPYKLDGEQKLFYLSKKTIDSISRIAKDAGIKREQDVILKEQPAKRFLHNKEMAHLEQNIFRYPVNPYQEENQAIKMFEASSPANEVWQMCLLLQEMIRKNNWCYRYIAVVTGDLGTYGPLIENRFQSAGIPYFMDQTRGIALNPVIEYIRSALAVVNFDFSLESVMHYLRSGLADFTMEEADIFENYLIEKGIFRKSRFTKQFVAKPNARKPKSDEEIKEQLERLAKVNGFRERLLKQLEPLFVKPDTAGEMVKALYEFLVSNQVEEKLHAYENEFNEQGDLSKAKEFGQIYGLIMELLDQIIALLPDEKMTLEEFSNILDAGFGEIEVGTIPQNVDRVVVGDIERTRLKPIKALFFMGVNDGIIPKNSGKGGMISDIDREFLSLSGYELSPTPRQQMYIQKLYLYMNMTKPTENLYVSYAKTGADGKSIRPSYLIAMFRKLFPLLTIQIPEKRSMKWLLETPKDGTQFFSTKIRQYKETGKADSELFSLYMAMKQGKSGKQIQQLLDAAFYRYEKKELPMAIAKMIYGSTLENSVSRLEQFAGCAYAHFLEYGLALKEREGYDFEAADLGNIFHGVLEDFAVHLKEHHSSWFDFTKEQGEEWITQSLDRQAAVYGDSILYANARNQYALTRIRRILKRTVFSLQNHLQSGAFVPNDFEMTFRQETKLSNVSVGLGSDEKMYIRGRIDRVDTCNQGDKLYVKVIDYKSGDKKFDLVSFYHGLQLQLVVYLNEAMASIQKKNPDKQVLPAAILYYHVADPMVVEEKDISTAEIDKAIAENLCMRGVVNQDDNIIELLDKDAHGAGTKSSIIPVALNKDGGLKESSDVYTTDEMLMMTSFVNEKIREIGTKILQGDIEKNPCQKDGRSSCTYCAFKGVCGFDKKIQGYKMRDIDMKKEEAENAIYHRPTESN